MADLDSERRIALGLHPEVQEELTQRQQQEGKSSPLENQLRQEMPYGATARRWTDISVLDERKGHGIGKNGHGRGGRGRRNSRTSIPIEGKGIKMTTVIDGQVITTISQKDYDKFLLRSMTTIA